ncbi:MAG: hypothetical protein ACOVP1_04680 [Bacteroidia bacterium]
MKSYIKRILNNCSEVSFNHLRKDEVNFPLKQRIEMKIHIHFCKCCRNFIHQSDIIDNQLKLYKESLFQEKEIKASEELKNKLDKIISEEV